MLVQTTKLFIYMDGNYTVEEVHAHRDRNNLKTTQDNYYYYY